MDAIFASGVSTMSIFLVITIFALLTIFSVDIAQKHREFMKQNKK